MAEPRKKTTRKTTRKTTKKAPKGARARASPANGSLVQPKATDGARPGEPEADTTASAPEQRALTATDGARPGEPEADTTASAPEQRTLTGTDGSTFLQQLMGEESFRAKVIARLVRKLT
jgi:hypothetical protein